MKKISILAASLLVMQVAGVQAQVEPGPALDAQAHTADMYMTPSFRMAQPRVSPMTEAELGESTLRLMDHARVEGTIANIFTTLAHHPELVQRWVPFAEQLLLGSTLPARDREIIVLRMGWLSQSEYEFAHHVAIGKQVGLSDADIHRIVSGADATNLPPFDAALIRAVDELNDDSFISDQTWKVLSGKYNTQQMIDLVFLAGHYKLVSMTLNSLGVQLEDSYKEFLRKP
ncbi:carboxymuconolactone decarboxylase family protein [Halopseudomonas sp. Lyrl_26]|uniref:carboxymuconolactone decarboxylase family protein n=1 Tax=Halopseudomonas sp. Lyrl_26 TaxID=3110923 RepID=UPI003F7EC7C8